MADCRIYNPWLQGQSVRDAADSGQLRGAGFTITDFTQPADVYVINTCSVTQAAERKSRQMVRRLARQNPDGVVVMTGCYGEMARIKGETVEEAALIVPNPEKLNTLNHVLRAFPELERRLTDDGRRMTD